MSNETKQMVSVTREGIERAIDAIDQVGYQDKFIDYTFVRSVKAELRALLNAEQPAPVAVVLPERKTVSIGLLSESNTHNQGWNACLDEVARLNPIKP